MGYYKPLSRFSCVIQYVLIDHLFHTVVCIFYSHPPNSSSLPTVSSMVNIRLVLKSVSVFPFFFLFFFLLWPGLQYIEIPRLGLNWSGSCRPMPQPQQHQMWLMPQLVARPDPLPTEQGQGSNLHPHRHYVGFLTHWATMGTPDSVFVVVVCFLGLHPWHMEI